MADITYSINQDNPNNIQGFEQFSQADTQLVNSFEVNTLFNKNKNYVELHILDLADNLLESDYSYNSYRELGNSQSAGKEGASILTIDPIQDIQQYEYNTGDVKLLYHFLNDLYSRTNKEVQFFIQDISPDRTEVKLQTFDLTDEEVLTFTNQIKEKLSTQSYFSEFRLNFKNNDLFIGLNIDTLLENGNRAVTVKLYEPLPVEYSLKSKLSIVETVCDSVAYIVDSSVDTPTGTQTFLRPANFNLDLEDSENNPTSYLSYDELFSFPVNNTNSELYSLTKEKGVELSIDYSDYNNFVHFSSAYERLANFKYKLQLIENYSSSLAQIQNTTLQSTGVTGSTSYYENLTQGIISNFDHYERFLYYESSSYAWPKSNTTKPYLNVSSSNTVAIDWYANQLTAANNYDLTNVNAAVYSIPSYLRDDPNNQNYLTFIHMIGQHFDNLWIYTKGVSDKYNADNRLDSGVSKDLVAEVLKNFGVKLYTSNKSVENLFSTLIGQAYQSGSEVINTYVTGSVTGSNTPIQPSSLENYQREVYKRIYHNLPLLLKSKGTERGLRALINCFGIPSDILKIKLYGGRDVEERPFYGDYRYYTGSLDKIRLDHTGSIVEGGTLSQYTSILKREDKYTDDLHPIEVGFSPTDNVDNYFISKSLTSGLENFNIDDYLGDPRNLFLENYYSLNLSGDVSGSLETVTAQLMSGSDAYNIQDYVRLIKFFDNTIFKMVKDFIPARSVADTGVIIKPHLLQRSKAKGVQTQVTQPEYSASIDTAFITGKSAGAFTSVVGTVDNELNTSYITLVQTPSGIATSNVHLHQEARINGELAGSNIAVANRELNSANVFKTPVFTANPFNVYRWLNTEGLCILNTYNTYTDVQGGIYYSSSNNTLYLNSGSWESNEIFTGLSQNMEYEITSSNQPTSSYVFPFNTDNYENYTIHHLTASNAGVEGECTSSVSIQVAVCEINTTDSFTSTVTNTVFYNVQEWFSTGSQNISTNIHLHIKNNISDAVIFDDLLSDSSAQAIQFNGELTDNYTLTVQDTAIPLTCTYTYTIQAGLCAVIPANRATMNRVKWKLRTYLGTADLGQDSEIPNVYNYGLARYFTGENPDNLRYRVEGIRDYTQEILFTAIVDPPVGLTYIREDEGEFDSRAGDQYNVFKYTWKYGPTTNPNITGNVALFKVEYTREFLRNFPQLADNEYVQGITLRITALELEPVCTPFVTIQPLEQIVNDQGLFLCLGTGQWTSNPEECISEVIP